ncbi:MAG TPA: PRC-barrel domain-containing protein [Pseudorhizobium sp.]|nr:PRC-barrel domain-containing protein [Pseudorhizobium sp.]
MTKTLTKFAAAAVLMASTAIAPAMAQTTTPAEPAAPAAPADPAMTPTDDSSTTAPAAGSTSPDSAAAPATDAGSTDNAAAPADDASTDTAAASGSYLTEQAETQISANDYIGQPVHNANDESIGDINDLILEENGGIVAAVVGVGGFLGIGEKDVAVPMDKITMTRDAENNNEVRLTTTETAESLQAAPEFMTIEDQQAAADSAATDATTTSATGTGTMPQDGATTPSTTQPQN